MVDEKLKNAIFYVCTMIEFVARETHNTRRDVIKHISDEDLIHQLKVAEVNHCLPYEQVCDEWIEDFKINLGSYDSVSECRYEVPTVTSIGRVYQQLVLDTMKDNDIVDTLKKVFGSFICDEITNFNSNVYYSNPDYIRCSFECGKLLA